MEMVFIYIESYIMDFDGIITDGVYREFSGRIFNEYPCDIIYGKYSIEVPLIDRGIPDLTNDYFIRYGTSFTYDYYLPI